MKPKTVKHTAGPLRSRLAIVDRDEPTIAAIEPNVDTREAAPRTGDARSKGLPVFGQVEVPVERADAARNRVAILDAARKLLRTRSIGEICMDELAEAAGVGKGTLYRRFADRSSLCRALLHDDAIELQTRVLAGFELPPEAPWLMKLDRLLEALFDFVVGHASLLSEAAAFERGDFGRFGHPAHAWQRQAVAVHLERAARAGELPALERPEVYADLILAGLDPDLVRFHLAKGRSVAELREDFKASWRYGVLGRRRTT